MAVVSLYLDLLRTLSAVPYGYPVWPWFAEAVYRPHQPYFDGLLATYGEDLFGPAGLPGAVEQMAPALRAQLHHAPFFGLEQAVERCMARVGPLLPGTPPDIYLGTLFFTAPAATIAVEGRPAMALGLERFCPAPVGGQGQKYWYHPAEVVEMVPHEAAHAARMQVLGLPSSPRHLSLLEMIMLEGTALSFADQLLGRQTLATFLPAERLAWHQAHDAEVRAAVAPDLERTGMDLFLKYFSTDSPISGYWAGYSYCQEYLARHGQGAMSRLLALPSREILESCR